MARRKQRPTVFGFVGAKGAGKDSLAAHLRDRYGFGVLGMADALKDLCAEQFGWDAAKLMGPGSQAYKEAASHVDPATGREWTRREVLQHIGTEGFRHVDSTFWTRKAVERARVELANRRTLGLPLGVSFADVRFANEAEMIHEAFGDGAVIVSVELVTNAPKRIPIVEFVRNLRRGSAQHASETEWKTIRADHVMAARFGELARLYAELDHICAARGIKPV